jgi:hypothetical protein
MVAGTCSRAADLQHAEGGEVIEQRVRTERARWASTRAEFRLAG